jgi:deazaflavin-dependent oxidoreductase (nitroreductase family)
MSTATATTNPRRGLLRLFLKSPLFLYRIHMQWLLSKHYILLIHRGRKSGRIYRTVVEVISEKDGELFISSGWGTRSDWYRNITSGGAVEVRTRKGSFAPQIRVLDSDEALNRHIEYMSERPRAARFALALT